MSAVYRRFWSIDINNLTRTVAKYDKQRELKKQDMTLLNTKVKLWENKARKLKMNNETMEGELGRGNIRCTPIIRCIFLSRSHNVKMTKEKKISILEKEYGWEEETERDILGKWQKEKKGKYSNVVCEAFTNVAVFIVFIGQLISNIQETYNYFVALRVNWTIITYCFNWWAACESFLHRWLESICISDPRQMTAVPRWINRDTGSSLLSTNWQRAF